MRIKKIVISKLYVTRLILMVCISAFFTSCSTSMVDLQTDARKPDAGNAIVVGSFLIEPVPEWQNPPDNYYLSILKSPVPMKQFTLSLQPNKEEDVLIQLPAGIYCIAEIVDGRPGLVSAGYGRKGELGLWFEIKEGEILYIGRLHIIISREPGYLREQRDRAVDEGTRVITSIILGQAISGMTTGSIMYTAVAIEDNLQRAVELLRHEGWSESAIKRLRKSLITTSRPSRK